MWTQFGIGDNRSRKDRLHQVETMEGAGEGRQRCLPWDVD